MQETTAIHPLEALERELGKRYSGETVRVYLAQARMFLDKAGVKETYARHDILGYIDTLIEQGSKQRSVGVALAAIRAMLRGMGQTWPLSRQDLHMNFSQQMEPGPALSLEDVKKLVEGVKGLPDGWPKTLTAVSTTYGLRPLELTWVLGAGIEGTQVKVATAKGGRVRKHLVPEGMDKYLRLAPTELTRDQIHREFQSLMVQFVRPLREREGWHSVRRALVTQLRNSGVGLDTISRWMGWKMPPERGLETAYGYYQPTTSEVESVIFEKHPFLGFWKEL